DPADLRIRTWVNDELVQDDSTSTLLFDFGRLVADLSQLITLETGDVILTGTPAGSSVVQPGDVVEVEVTGGARTTGRLRTEVVEGTVPLADYGAGPKIDDTQRAEAYGARYATGSLERYSTTEAAATSAGRVAPQARIETTGPIPDDLIARINSVGTATLSVQLRRRGINNATIDGLRPTQPGKRLVGTAR